MTYAETIAYLYDSAPLFQQVGGAAYKEGLSNTHVLDAHFEHPHTKFRTIHVAGTNGKGSCAHTLAALLQHAGYKVGLYTSPHLVDFRERIRVNGTMVSEQYVIDFVENERAFFEPLHPSFFELTTALAFKYFADSQVDVAVIEVGLGGRLDCTNIITPVLSVITNISLDHTQFLGHSLAQIAAEKGGIIKPGIPVVVGESCVETRQVFQRIACDNQASVYWADENPEVLSSVLNSDGHRIYQTRSFGELTGELAGECQIKNTNTLLAAIRVLTPLFNLHPTDVAYAFSHVCSATGLRGRWQQLVDSPKVICDTGHNVGGWEYLGKQLHQALTSYSRVHIVFGMANDKDVESVLCMLPDAAEYYWTRSSVKRSLDETTLSGIAAKHGLHGNTYDTVAAAYQAALTAAAPDDFIYIGGSSFVVADLLAALPACKG